MKQTVVLAALCSFLLFSCKPGKKKMLIGKWNATAIENPYVDSGLMMEKQMLDTLGKTTTPEQNLALYGTKNIDSLKQDQYAKLDTMINRQQFVTNNTWFQFNEDGSAVLHYGDMDAITTSWHLNDSGKLLLDVIEKSSFANNLDINIILLTDSSLRIQQVKNEVSNYISFTKERK